MYEVKIFLTHTSFSQFILCVLFHVKKKITPLLGFLVDISLSWGSGGGGVHAKGFLYLAQLCGIFIKYQPPKF